MHTCNINTQGPREKHQEFKANLAAWGLCQEPFIVSLPCAMCGGEDSDNSQIKRCSSGGQLWVNLGLASEIIKDPRASLGPMRPPVNRDLCIWPNTYQ